MEEPSLAGVLMLEYQQLKEEQRLRIGIRDHLVYATLGAIAMAIAGAVQTGAAELLLLTPPVCLALGWTYLVNDDRVTALGRHVQMVLSPQLTRLLGADIPLFGWEQVHRGDRWRRGRKKGQLAVDLLIFCVPALAALLIACLYSGLDLALGSIAFFEAVGIGLFAVRLTTHAWGTLSS